MKVTMSIYMSNGKILTFPSVSQDSVKEHDGILSFTAKDDRNRGHVFAFDKYQIAGAGMSEE